MSVECMKRVSMSLASLLIAMAIVGMNTHAFASIEEGVGIHVIDLTPRFMSFYSEARDVEDTDVRFQLWKDHYDFVALPPGMPDRDELARRRLDRIWDRYAEAVPHIHAGASMLSPPPAAVFKSVAELLGVNEPLPPIGLLYFVGMFEDNAFFAPNPDGSLIVAIPAEMAPEKREISMAHEFTHAFHFLVSGRSAQFGSSVADVVFGEGLAMHSTRALFPESPDLAHLGADEDWRTTCEASIDQILAGMRPYLGEDHPEEVNRFTVGEGATGLEREAYCAGWHLVARLLAEGSSLGELAQLPRSEMLDVVSGAIELDPGTASRNRDN